MSHILIIEDHPLYRAAIEQALGQVGHKSLASTRLEEGLETLQGHPSIELVLLDLQIPGVIGFEGIAKIKQISPQVKLAILSAHINDELVSKAISLGADAYLSKSLAGAELEVAIDDILSGKRVLPDGIKLQHQHQIESVNQADAAQRLASLTPQQAVILDKLCDGKLNKQIAFDLNISETTVKAHITAILRKLNVVNRTQAVLVAQSVRVDEEGTPFSRDAK